MEFDLTKTAKKAIESVIDNYEYRGKPIRDWINFIANNANDLISRDKAISSAYWHGEDATWDNPYPDGAEAVDVADLEALSSECPESKTGRWIIKSGDIICSECQFGVNDPFYLGEGVACPNCGVPMSGGLKEYYGIEE